MEQEKVITPTIGKILLKQRKNFTGQFIKGPLPMSWMSEACKLSKNAIKVALAIRFLGGILGDDWMELKNNHIATFKLNRSGKSIGLRELETSGLIKIKRRAGKSPLVKIIEVS